MEGPLVTEVPTGAWQDRVGFSPGGGFAYRPGEVLVRGDLADHAEDELRRTLAIAGVASPDVRREPLLQETFTRLRSDFDTLRALDALATGGIPAQPNHVLFATGCCPPHPSSPEAAAFYANPFYAHALEANPFYAHPFYAHAGMGGGCCCCVGGSRFGGNPFYAHPFYAHAAPSPFMDSGTQSTGRRRSSARPHPTPHLGGSESSGGQPVRIAILDTGWAETHTPTLPFGMHLKQQGGDWPDADGDRFLDPAAGHGTFIAGLVEREAPGCELEVISVLTTYGDGDEVEIADALLELARRPDGQRPHLVNLSFGGYTPIGMTLLAHAISELRRTGSIVVAAAGNDGTCRPLYPAALPGVIGVGATDEHGNPAPFSNYGPWVRACSNGVDVVSIFFDGFDGAEPTTAQGGDEDRFEGWAVWSGTSFSAPRVAAALARLIQDGTEPADAVAQLIDNPQADRRPMLGTLVATP